jgi:rubrerythrin
MGSGYLIGCVECMKNEDKSKKGTVFSLCTGGVMLCFCKEQLEKIYGINKDYNREYRLLAGGDPPDEVYKRLGTATHDEKIDKIIYEKLNNGFEFTEILGSLPYYCETCKKLYTHFYFQMKKNKEIYIPNYSCKNCNNILEPVCPTLGKVDSRDWLGQINWLSQIKFNISIYTENDLIKLKSKDNEKILICDHCGNKNFSISGWCNTD